MFTEAIKHNKILTFCIVGIFGLVLTLIIIDKETSTWWITLIVGIGLTWIASFMVGYNWHLDQLDVNKKISN